MSMDPNSTGNRGLNAIMHHAVDPDKLWAELFNANVDVLRADIGEFHLKLK